MRPRLPARNTPPMRGPASFAPDSRALFLQGDFVVQSNLSSKLHIGPHIGLHVGIIMDGNGRWATRRRLPRLRGHEAGVEAVRRVVAASSGCRFPLLCRADALASVYE